MSSKKIFDLPDLGEGLPDAEIVQWHVNIGDDIRLDEPLVSMETAKAIVDVPSPFSGKLIKIAGKPGDIINTGAWLAEFEIDDALPQRAQTHDSGHHRPSKPSAPSETKNTEQINDSDAGTVVGAMQSSDQVRSEHAVIIGGNKAMPAVRALAKKLGINLASITATGDGGVVTIKDLRTAAENRAVTIKTDTAVIAEKVASNPTVQSSKETFDTDQPIRGLRRRMLRTMSDAHAQVVPTTLMDDADIHAWSAHEDITVRLIRSIVIAAKAAPALNAWLNAQQGSIRLHSRVDIGIAVDSEDGLFVPALRRCDQLPASQIRAGINRIRELVKTRSIPADELRDYTIMLSNFGVFAGKYATPVVVPPCVAIIGAGRLFHQAVPVLGGMQAHRILPISLTFDHRACTGGEAARFLRALLDDLQEQA